MRVLITEEDVAVGDPSRPRDCPVALALRRKRGMRSVRVGISNVSVTREVGGGLYHTSRKLQEEIRRFDAGEGMTPGVYRLHRWKWKA